MQPPDTSPIWKTPEAHTAFEAWYDGELARLRAEVPVESLFVETRFGVTHSLAAGDPASPPLLLVMGLGGNALGWFPQMTALSHHYRVYAPDTPGQPGRSAPVHPSHRGADFGWWLVDVLDGLGAERTLVVGLSLGGRIAVKLGGIAADRVAKLALVSPMGIRPLNMGLLVKLAPVGMNLRPIPREEGQALLGGIMSPSLDVGASPIRHYFEAMLLFGESYRQEGLIAGLPMALPLPRAELRNCRPPTLVLFGERERLFNPRAAADRVRRDLPNLARAEIVPGVGHFMTYENAGAVNERLLAFLEQGD
jgi:pimeloyl-ACP methyl ester carboxylesterase